MNKTVQLLIKTLQNSRNKYTECELRDFVEKTHLVFKKGSSRYVIIANEIVIKLAINSYGIDQNRTETKHSGEPGATLVLENYNNVIIVAPKYETLQDRIHKFLTDDTYFKNIQRGQSVTNDILLNIQTKYATRNEAKFDEFYFSFDVISEIGNLFPKHPIDMHPGNFGIDYKNPKDLPIMIDTGIDEAFHSNHEDCISHEVFTITNTLEKLFEKAVLQKNSVNRRNHHERNSPLFNRSFTK